MGCRKTSHGVYDIKYQIVWRTKYRKMVIKNKIAERTREIIKQICKDNIHLLVSVPPHISASKLVQYLKGSSARKLLLEFKELNKIY